MAFTTPFLPWRSKKYYIFLRVCLCVGLFMHACSFTYLACKAHAPYSHMWPLKLHQTFRNYLTKETIFKNRFQHKMCVLIFSTTFIRNISYSKKNSVTYGHRCKNVFLQSTLYLCQILKKLAFHRQLFEKKSLTSYQTKIFPVGAKLFIEDGQTDGHDTANGQFSQFCEDA